MVDEAGKEGVSTLVKEPDVVQRRRAFGEALSRAMAVRKMSQEALGATVGVKQPTIAGYIAGEYEPSPMNVFKFEEVLELPAGHLSKLLGYVPPEAVGGPGATFDEIVAGDPLLDDTQKRGILALYREFTSRKPGGRGRPPRKRS